MRLTHDHHCFNVAHGSLLHTYLNTQAICPSLEVASIAIFLLYWFPNTYNFYASPNLCEEIGQFTSKLLLLLFKIKRWAITWRLLRNIRNSGKVNAEQKIKSLFLDPQTVKFPNMPCRVLSMHAYTAEYTSIHCPYYSLHFTVLHNCVLSIYWDRVRQDVTRYGWKSCYKRVLQTCIAYILHGWLGIADAIDFILVCTQNRSFTTRSLPCGYIPWNTPVHLLVHSRTKVNSFSMKGHYGPELFIITIDFCLVLHNIAIIRVNSIIIHFSEHEQYLWVQYFKK